MDFFSSKPRRVRRGGALIATVEFKDGAFSPEGAERARAILGQSEPPGLPNSRLNIVARSRGWFGGSDLRQPWYDLDVQRLIRRIDECAWNRQDQGPKDFNDSGLSLQGRSIYFFGGPIDGAIANSITDWEKLKRVAICVHGVWYIPILMRKNYVYVAFVAVGVDLNELTPGKFLFEDPDDDSEHEED